MTQQIYFCNIKLHQFWCCCETDIVRSFEKSLMRLPLKNYFVILVNHFQEELSLLLNIQKKLFNNHGI